MKSIAPDGSAAVARTQCDAPMVPGMLHQYAELVARVAMPSIGSGSEHACVVGAGPVSVGGVPMQPTVATASKKANLVMTGCKEQLVCPGQDREITLHARNAQPLTDGSTPIIRPPTPPANW